MSEEPGAGQYEGFAGEYEAHAEVAPYNRFYDRPAVLELVDEIAGDLAGLRILDAGCGPGIYAHEFMRRGAEVVGCDASAEMVKLARERLGCSDTGGTDTGGTVDVRVHSLDEPFDWLADRSVDLVVSALVHHYLNDRPGFLREMHRVLRDDGSLVLSTHHPTSDWQRLGGSYFTNEPVTETWSKGWEITAWRVPLTQLAAEFAQAGFVIDRLIEPLPHPDMRNDFASSYDKLSTQPGFVLFRLTKRR